MSHPNGRVDRFRTECKKPQIYSGTSGTMISPVNEFRDQERAFTRMGFDQDLISDDPHTFLSHAKLIGSEIYPRYGFYFAGLAIAPDQLGTWFLSEGPFVGFHRFVEKLNSIQWYADRSGYGQCYRNIR